MVPLSQSDTLQEVLAAAQEKAGAAAQARASPLRDEPPSESAALAQEHREPACQGDHGPDDVYVVLPTSYYHQLSSYT